MSLIFGGYDASRLGRDSIQVTFTPDAGRELTVGLQSVTKVSASGNTTLLSNAILARLDSSQPYIWLPLSSCQLFEQAFGLVWDGPTETYLVNDALHTQLVSENASVVFTLSDGVQGSKSIDVNMPYGNFDLQYRVPTQTNSSRYFPLRRAANNTQYVLGRAFLQEVYLIADYEKSTFNVSQISWNDTRAQDIRIIASSSSTAGSQSESSSFGGGAIAGVVIGILSLLAILGAGFYLYKRRRAKDLAAVTGQDEKASEPESPPDRPDNSADDKKLGPDELDGGYVGSHEVNGLGSKPGELAAPIVRPSEMEGHIYMPVEMDARPSPGELEGETVRHELAGDETMEQRSTRLSD